jgi:holin-like protein
MRTLQGLTLLLLCQALGEALARLLALPLPGPVVGLALLLPLLAWQTLRAPVEAAAAPLLAHLSLLFVPVGVGVVVHLPLLGAQGARIALVLVVSTVLGMAATALVLRALLRGEPLAED